MRYLSPPQVVLNAKAGHACFHYAPSKTSQTGYAWRRLDPAGATRLVGRIWYVDNSDLHRLVQATDSHRGPHCAGVLHYLSSACPFCSKNGCRFHDDFPRKGGYSIVKDQSGASPIDFIVR